MLDLISLDPSEALLGVERSVDPMWTLGESKPPRWITHCGRGTGFYVRVIAITFR